MTNAEYEAARNNLIPLAAAKADEWCGPKPKWTKKTDHLYARWRDEWDRKYFETMNQLAALSGLI